VKQNLNTQRASTSNGPALANLSFLDAPDADTLTVKLKTPWSAFPNVLTQFYTAVVAPPALQGEGLARKPVGTGPFTLAEWRPNDRMVLACNDAYWGDKPKVGSIEFRFIPDEAARLAALRAGDVDAAWLLLKDSIESAQADKKLKTYRGPYAGQSITLFNTSAPPLDDVNLRTALVKSVDRKALSDAFATPGSEDAYGPFPKDHPWYVETAYPAYDAAGAKRMVADWSAANGGKKPAVTLSYTAGGNQLIDDVIVAVQQYWQAAGFDVKLDKQVDATGFVTQVVLGNYQAAGFVAGLDPDPDLTLYNGIHQLGAFNFARFKNAALSDLLDKGRQAASEAERRSTYKAALDIVGQQVPVAYGTFGGSWISVTARVAGMEQFKTFVFPTRLVGVTG
jgi:peptide/nickel transport system substrate-binding protein